jgi:rRNA-processing protein FCF1
MVPGEDHDVFRAVATNDVEVLRHRIRRAAVPVFTVNALLSRKQIDKLVHLFAEE